MAGAYRVGARKSPLALRQVEEILGHLKEIAGADIDAEIVGIDTRGDRDAFTPISDIEGTDFFTREIELKLLGGEIDFAVHSAKDLPDNIPDGLCVPAITGSLDPYDALVSKHNLKLSELRFGARIGTSSARRKNQLKSYRGDFQIVDIRGNIDERLKLLDFNEIRNTNDERRNIDAVIVAACALVRLGLEHRIAERIPFEILMPHLLQGSLAVETRKDDIELIRILSKIDSRKMVSI
jgi:hydroxymethylbilane synthase